MNVPAESKVCSRCKCEKPLSDFSKDRCDKKYGRRSRCKACDLAVATEQRAKRPEIFEKHCGGCGVTKPVSAFYRSKRTYDGFCTQCKTCADARAKAWCNANPERVKDLSHAYYEANKSVYLESGKQWRLNNLEKARRIAREVIARARAKDPEKYRRIARESRNRHKDVRNAYAREWFKKNPDIACAHWAARRSRKRNAFPAWANKEAIRQFYEIARKLTDGTGESWHVDHIVPLKNDLVCGLHVHNNLRVIRGADNLRKHNRFDPDMPD